MNRSSVRLRRAMALVVPAAALIVAGIAWTLHQQSVHLDETAGMAEHTRTTEGAIESVSLAALDAESAQRSLLLGSPYGLPRYREAVTGARASLATLDHEIGGDPDQAALLAGLHAGGDAH